MNLTLNEKQLVRSFSDIIVHNPESARKLINTKSIPQLDIFGEINSLITFIDSYGAVGTLDERYLTELKEEIDKIPNSELKIILNSSLKVSQKQK